MRGGMVIAGIAGLGAFFVAAAVAQPSTTVGVYSAAQASEGAALYAARCAMCHGATLEGTYETPALRGKFVANWGRAPLSDLFDYVSRAMPQSAPGSLAPADNAKIVAYLLQQNGMPAGANALPAESDKLKSIVFLPPSAH